MEDTSPWHLLSDTWWCCSPEAHLSLGCRRWSCPSASASRARATAPAAAPPRPAAPRSISPWQARRKQRQWRPRAQRRQVQRPPPVPGRQRHRMGASGRARWCWCWAEQPPVVQSRGQQRAVGSPSGTRIAAGGPRAVPGAGRPFLPGPLRRPRVWSAWRPGRCLRSAGGRTARRLPCRGASCAVEPRLCNARLGVLASMGMRGCLGWAGGRWLRHGGTTLDFLATPSTHWTYESLERRARDFHSRTRLVSVRFGARWAEEPSNRGRKPGSLIEMLSRLRTSSGVGNPFSLQDACCSLRT